MDAKLSCTLTVLCIFAFSVLIIACDESGDGSDDAELSDEEGPQTPCEEYYYACVETDMDAVRETCNGWYEEVDDAYEGGCYRDAVDTAFECIDAQCNNWDQCMDEFADSIQNDCAL